MTDREQLAARIEAAGGPDRELDAAIAVAVRYFPKGVGFVWQDELRANSPERGRVECCTNLGTGGPHYSAPHYTASLDAAMMLVPEGFYPLIDFHDNSVALWQFKDGRHHEATFGNGKTVPLALAAAAIRAGGA